MSEVFDHGIANGWGLYLEEKGEPSDDKLYPSIYRVCTRVQEELLPSAQRACIACVLYPSYLQYFQRAMPKEQMWI